MPPIIVGAAGLADVVGMIVLFDEVFYLFTFLLVILGFIFIIDLGFDIEEGSATVSATLAAMALRKRRLAADGGSNGPSGRSCCS